MSQRPMWPCRPTYFSLFDKTLHAVTTWTCIQQCLLTSLFTHGQLFLVRGRRNADHAAVYQPRRDDCVDVASVA